MYIKGLVRGLITMSFDEWYEDHGDGTGYDEAFEAWAWQQKEIVRLEEEVRQRNITGNKYRRRIDALQEQLDVLDQRASMEAWLR